MSTSMLWGSDDQATLRDPYPAYAQLRASAPWYDHPDGYTVVSRHHDVLAALAHENVGYEDDPVQGVASRTGEGPFASNIGSWLLSMNNPRHNSLRRLIGPAFLPRNVARLRDGVAERVRRQFDALVAAGGGDALQEIAFEIPSDLICQLMGVPPADRGALAKLTNSVATLLFEAAPGQQMIDEGNDAVRGIDEYFGALVEERRRNRGEDLISIMLNVQDKSEDITDYELLANVHFMYGAGYEETHCFIASGILHLLANPGLAGRQRTDGDGGAAVQRELLRYDTPLQSTLRLVREDTEINGHGLRKGQRLQLLIGSARRSGLLGSGSVAITIRPWTGSAGTCASARRPRTARWKRSNWPRRAARGSSACNGILRTPQPPTPRSTRSSPRWPARHASSPVGVRRADLSA